MADQVGLLERVPERTTKYLDCGFLNADNELDVPTGVTYRIDDVKSGRQIVGDTVISPAEEVTITITPEQNRILNPQNPEEVRKVTVKATYGVSDELNDDFLYVVRNLKGVA